MAAVRSSWIRSAAGEIVVSRWSLLAHNSSSENARQLGRSGGSLRMAIVWSDRMFRSDQSWRSGITHSGSLSGSGSAVSLSLILSPQRTPTALAPVCRADDRLVKAQTDGSRW